MPEKLPFRGKKKIPYRGKKALATNAKATRTKKRKKRRKQRQTNRIKFTKTSLQNLPTPRKGTRNYYRDEKIPHLALRVTPTAKTFYWEARINGRQRKITLGRYPAISIDQARELAQEISGDYAKGIDVKEERSLSRDEMTLGDLWHDYRENRKRKVPGQYSPTLDRQWKKHFKRWANKKLTDITFTRARRMILDIRKTAPIHANRIQRQGQAMFNHAKRELRWQGDNPFDFGLVSEKGRARKERIKPKEMPQFEMGLQACSESMGLLFRTALYTGRRMGEVQAMRWEDLDLDEGIWTIPSTKSGEPQEAVLPTALVAMLVERKATASSPWVFPSPSKSGHVEEIKKAWEQVREASGLHHLQARDLRRTHASWAQDLNAPIAVVQEILGHAEYSTTAKHYTKIHRSVQRAVLDETVGSMLEASNRG